jgi:TPR repeat protein
MYENAEGVTQDYKLAVKWCRKAAKQGHTGGQLYLGIMLATG